MLAGRGAFRADRSGAIRHPFNESFCSECHSVPTTGGSQFLRDDFAIKTVSRSGAGSTFERYELVHGIVAFRKLPARYYERKPQPLYGVGLLEAVPADELRAIVLLQQRKSPQHSGRISLLRDGTIGRFGWKAAFPTLRAFVSSAFRSELGMRAPPDAVAIVVYLEHLAAPPGPPQKRVEMGRLLFEGIGCADCHRPSLRIGSFSAVPKLSGTAIDPYTDLLLHDMGAADADVSEGAARASEFRTPPLWGVAQTGPPYLHDGRAATLSQAIVMHGGQAADSARKYGALSAVQRAAIVAFLRSL